MRGCPVRRGGSAPKGRTPGASASGRGGAERRRVEQHMAKFVSPDLGALVFAGPTGAPIRRSNFGKMSGWTHAVASIGAEGLHFHDLRHTGNTFAAAGGAGIKDLMARMGHDSERAAMIYQHQARGADKAITDSIDAHVEAERRKPDDDDGAAGRPGAGRLMAR